MISDDPWRGLDPWRGQSLSVGSASSAITIPEKTDPCDDESEDSPFYYPAPEYSFWLALTVCKLFWHTWWDAPTGEMCFWCYKRKPVVRCFRG